MKTIKTSLPGIKKIGWLRADSLPPDLTYKSLAQPEVPLMANPQFIGFAGHPSVNVETKLENGGLYQEATLEFMSDCDIPTGSALAFVVVDANGDAFLLGSKEKPHAVVECTRNFGAPSGEPNVTTFKVTHKNLKTLLRISNKLMF